MTEKPILFLALAGALYAATAFASITGAKGNADRIALRPGYSQYEGKVDLRDAAGAVVFYFWGGDRCAAAPVAPTERQVDLLLSAHLNGHAYQLDYNNSNSQYGASRCWDGGIQVW